MNKDLIKLGIDMDQYQNIHSLFDKSNVDNKNYCLKRLKFILNVYQHWVNLKNENKNVNVNIVDFINVKISQYYNFEYLLVDYKYIIKNKHLLGYHNDEKGDEEKKDECNVYNCYVIDRYERSKDYH
eukprot:401843_1